jgi:MFS family permease
MPKPTKSSDPYAAFRYANYRYYTFGNFLSVIGQQMMRLAVGYKIFQQTQSYLDLGLVGLVIWLPIFFFMLPGGGFADRFNRKYIVLSCNLLYALCATGLALAPLSTAPLPVMYAFLFLTGFNRAFSDPARQALLPQLVPKKDFTNAITWNSSIYQIASVAGPALGGMLYAAIGYSKVCGLEFLLELIFFANVLAIRQVPVNFKREPVTLKSLLTGLRFVRQNKLILATITMDLFAVLLGGSVAMLPAFADKVLHCGPVGLGWLQAAPAMGAFLVTLFITHLPPMKKAGHTLLWAVAGFGAATVVFGLSGVFWLSFLMLLLTGALDLVSVIVRSTLVQVLTPDSMRGRVNAVSYIFIHSSNELGGFESGAVAALIGLVPSVVLGGLGSILVVLAVTRIWPQVAQLGSLQNPMKKTKSQTKTI